MLKGGVTESRAKLEEAGIQISAQRLAIADYVLFTDEHPNADRVLERVHSSFPIVSRATVYNTLNLFVQRGLLKELVIHEGHVVFDPELQPHHHFVDTDSGEIIDVPESSVPIAPVSGELKYGSDALHVREVQVVLRGSRRPRNRRAPGEKVQN